MTVDQPKENPMTTTHTQPLDLDAIQRRWLVQCGAHDAGLPMACTCPDGDPRPNIHALVEEVERLRALLEQTRHAMVGQHDFAGHVLADECGPCRKAADSCDPAMACAQYRQWQRAYEAALSAGVSA